MTGKMTISRRSLIAAPLAAGALSAQTATRGQSTPSGKTAHSGPERILLLSGWNIKNIGDVAHTPGFLRLVEKHCPNVQVTVAISRYFEETKEYLKQRFPWVDCLPRPFRPNEPIPEEFHEAFRKSTCLILNSGMTISYGYFSHDFTGILTNVLPMMMAREAGKPYGIFGHSIDTMDPPAEVLLQPLLSNAKFIYTRDSVSLKLLSEKKATPPILEFGPDAAFGFDLRDDVRAKGFMQASKLEPGRFIVFIPRIDIDKLRGGDSERLPKHAAHQRAVIERYVRETGEQVAIVAEVENQIAKAKQLVYEPLPEEIRKKVVFRDEFWWPDEALGVFVHARSVTSLEMHSVIMAIGSAIPALHPYFPEVGSKQWMMKDIGLEEWMFDIDRVPPSAISDTLLSIHRNPAAARKAVEKGKAFVEAKQTEMMRVVARTAGMERGATQGRR